MHVIAIIPARGGSKGIPRKNVRPVGGVPLVAHSVLAARAVPQIETVYVSTDDPEIAAVAREYGAEVIDRPAELASDTATSESALLHVLDTLAARKLREPDAVVFLQPTSPLRRPSDIPEALATFVSQGADSLFSATPAHGFMWRVVDGGARPLNYDPVARPRRQDAPVDVIENGSLYIFKPAVLRQHGSRLAGRIAVHMMRPQESFQVDEPWELELMAWLHTRASGDAPVASAGTDPIRAHFSQLRRVTEQVMDTLANEIRAAGQSLASCIAGGNKILACGNGGSAADAQHFAAELVGRLKAERGALPSISLSSDPSVVTCLANDYGYDQVFARQVEAFGRPGDVLLAISTSGRSPNVLNAARVARARKMQVVSLTGSAGKTLTDLSDISIAIPSTDTQCIQELHMAVLHVLCGAIDQRVLEAK